MPRPRGTRNQNYQARRRALLKEARGHLSAPGMAHASMRELAAACGITLPTLRHYFGRREDLITEILRDGLEEGQPHIARMRRPEGSFPESIRAAAFFLAFGFRSTALAELSLLGLTEGLGHRTLGPAFVDYVLEPAVQAAAERLKAHMASGEMRQTDPRYAALTLVSPIILAFIHQTELGGAEHHPLDIDAFLEEHAGAFVRAYRAPDGGSSGK